jgi:hypothetical protein
MERRVGESQFLEEDKIMDNISLPNMLRFDSVNDSYG